jgi:hypothetical protein
MVEVLTAMLDLVAEVVKFGPNGIAILALIVALSAVKALGRRTYEFA